MSAPRLSPEGAARPPRAWSLSGWLVLLMMVGSTLACGLMSIVLLAWRLPDVQEQASGQVQQEARVLASRTELLLDAMEQRLRLLGAMLESTEPEIAVALVARPLRAGDLLDVIVLSSPGGEVLAAGLQPKDAATSADLSGMDLSNSPLLRGAQRTNEVLWSGRHLSMFSGQLALGLSMRLPDGRQLSAEIQLSRLLDDVHRLHDTGESKYLGVSHVWLVNQQGEVLADTEGSQAVGTLNLHGTPMLRGPLAGATAPAGRRDEPVRLDHWQHGGVDQLVATARSARLGWHFLARMPAGLDHPRARSILLVAAASILLTGVFSMLLTPLLARPMVRAIDALLGAANDEALGRPVQHWPQGRSREMNQLSERLGWMASLVRQRETDLRGLNADLEQRVSERTQALATANQALQASMDDLKNTRDDLMRNERLASLGGMVAGVAHELNTPLGNSLLAVSTLRDEARLFRDSLAQGLRRSSLDRLLEGLDTATDIAGRNLDRAADLVTSFKQVAVDQTSGQRRRFDLQAVVQELLLTLRPTLSRTPYQLVVDVPAGLQLDSFPGSLGQILTNLVNNAVLHGFDGRAHGTVHIAAQREGDDGGGDGPGPITLTVRDDGLGIPPALIGRIFDPFVTTRMGRGGTGLGLNIAHSIATNILGGDLSVGSVVGEGTCFSLRLPVEAPRTAVDAGLPAAELAELA